MSVKALYPFPQLRTPTSFPLCGVRLVENIHLLIIVLRAAGALGRQLNGQIACVQQHWESEFT